MWKFVSPVLLVCMFMVSAGFSQAPAKDSCIQPPPPPRDASSDWVEVVHPNCFKDIERLGLWVGGTAPLRPKQSPESKFKSVEPNSLTGDVTVVVHGWAPGFGKAVNDHGHKIKWWDTGATNSAGVYSSDWAWVPTSSNDPTLEVTKTGMFQEITRIKPTGVVLGFSWIDDSATGGSFLDLIDVYRSEAYTNLNGLRLANALSQVLRPDFFINPKNNLHIIGHSHGSKVATVAALALQNEQKFPNQLTILDSPESTITLMGNGANLLGFYLPRMTQATFIDNYSSIFGVSYPLLNLVNVALNPSQIYSSISAQGVGDQHSYAAAWYAGAAVGAKQCGTPRVGLLWPPPPSPNRPALNQTFPLGLVYCSQWPLTKGLSIRGALAYSFPPLTYTTYSHTSNVRVGSNYILFKASTDGKTSRTATYRGGYINRIDTNGYGVGFNLKWQNPQAGDYFVVTVDAPEEGNFGEQEVILVLQGQTAFAGLQSMSFNADVSSGPFRDVAFNMFFIPAENNTTGAVEISNLQTIVVSSAPNRRALQ